MVFRGRLTFVALILGAAWAIFVLGIPGATPGRAQGLRAAVASTAEAVQNVKGTETPFNIGFRNLNYTDPIRGNRNVAAQVYYPSMLGGQDAPIAGGGVVSFPVVVFGHGFVIASAYYPYVWQALVPAGYVVALCDTETGFQPNHTSFAQDLAFLVDTLQAENVNPASPFYGAITAASAVMGHSMGGGAALLSAQYSSRITTIIPMAAAETTPSAIAAVASITSPVLMFSGLADCVAPPSQHQIPMYQALASSCKFLETIMGGSHCQFAVDSAVCNFAETVVCPGSAFIDASKQRALVLDAVLPWLDNQLRGSVTGRIQFLQQLKDHARQEELTYEYGCVIVGQDVRVSFTASSAWGKPPFTVQFMGTATNVDPTEIMQWDWDFGDGASIIGDQPNPVHRYDDVGTYTVSVTINTLAGVATETKTGFVVVSDELAFSKSLVSVLLFLVLCIAGVAYSPRIFHCGPS